MNLFNKKIWRIEPNMKELLRTRLHRGDALKGTLVSLPSLETAEVLADVGFDWFFVDLEHTQMGVPEAQAILQAVGERVDCVLRIPLNDEIWVKKALDTGAPGIMVPQVNTADDARRVVCYCKYPLQGTRSVSGARANHYGVKLAEYLLHANDEIAVVIQCEHIRAVENIEAILSVEGLDAVFIGPYDLSASMGLIGQPGHPEVQAAIERVRQACQAHAVPLGIFAGSTALGKGYYKQGFSLVATSGDTLMLGQVARTILAELQE
jgi:2-dehydro-3-deoxyglucarate aldolase/4-hydroxy-2-oxoheptanedioate aldolase